MNPLSLLKIKQSLTTFISNHPKFAQCIQEQFSRGLEEDTIIEIKVQHPGEDPIITNMKVKQSDLELLDSLKEMSF